jgi:hypothetical protein
MEPNISAWRRQNYGDFVSALNFRGEPAAWLGSLALRLSTADAELSAAQFEVDFNPAPSIPVVNEPFPPS